MGQLSFAGLASLTQAQADLRASEAPRIETIQSQMLKTDRARSAAWQALSNILTAKRSEAE